MGSVECVHTNQWGVPVNHFPLFGSLFIVAVLGCGRAESRPENRATGVADRCEVRRVARASTGGALINQAYSDSFPSAECRETNLGLEALHGALRDFRAMRGQFPDSLSQILELRHEVPALTPAPDWLRDGWGTPYGYERRGNGYRLRSAGPDRNIATADDLIDSTATP